MQCALNRFGPGTSTTRPNNTVLSKEMNDKLTLMRAERDKQDKMWDEPSDVINKNKNINIKEKMVVYK